MRNHLPFILPTSWKLQDLGDGPQDTSDQFGHYYEPSSAISNRLEGAANEGPVEASESGSGIEIRGESNECDRWNKAEEEQEYPSGGFEKEEKEKEERGKRSGKGKEGNPYRIKKPTKKLTPSASKSIEHEDKDKNKSNNQFIRRITLSQDRTPGSDYSRKQLLALAGNGRPVKEKQKNIIPETEASDISTNATRLPENLGPDRSPSHGNHALQDYQMQMMLLEQQQKRELTMAHLKQDDLTRADEPPRVLPNPDLLLMASTSLKSDSSMSNLRDVEDRGLAGAIPPHTGYERDMGQYEQFMNRIQALEQENILLRRFVDPDSTYCGPPFFQVLYRFKGDDRVFLRPPTWRRNTSSGRSQYILKGDPLSMRAEEYLKRSKALAFAIFKTYSSESVDYSSKEHDQEADMWPVPKPEAETILFVADYMREALDIYFNKQPSFKELFPRFDSKNEILAPCLFWYCCRCSHGSVLEELSPHHRHLMELFARWMTSNYEKECTQVDDQLSRGVISSASMKYLMKPGDVLVSSKDGHTQAYMAKSWAGQIPIMKHGTKDEHSTKFQHSWQVIAWSYDFDGSFYRKATVLTIEINVQDPTEEVALRDLSVVPMRYTDQETQMRLEQRGQTYWACRKKKLVSCRSSNDIGAMTNVSTPFHSETCV